jgi:hypothetical protein
MIFPSQQNSIDIPPDLADNVQALDGAKVYEASRKQHDI